MTYEQATALYNYYYEEAMGQPITQRNPWPIVKIKIVGEGNDWGVVCFTDRPVTEKDSWMDLITYLLKNDLGFNPRLFGLPKSYLDDKKK